MLGILFPDSAPDAACRPPLWSAALPDRTLVPGYCVITPSSVTSPLSRPPPLYASFHLSTRAGRHLITPFISPDAPDTPAVTIAALPHCFLSLTPSVRTAPRSPSHYC
ncbi:hypothetical protein E2C01_018165 [Portunus trituberculatus]|uniref:Uncharacterized protein n=1 Tax=Portunus trituberculatus TaxID=210409 RepID=A0A5B7DVP2_PORTR|nr:hypothetical protein [Portunus trituberculatus]